MQRLLILYCLLTIYGCSNIANFPLSSPNEKVSDPRIMGVWKLEEDTNTNNFYEVCRIDEPFKYHTKFWDKGGTNPTYESAIFFSEVASERFINVPYFDGRPWVIRYMFLRVLNVDKDFTRITAAVVGDTTMRRIPHPKALRRHVAGNIHNSAFYSDTIHLYKTNR